MTRATVYSIYMPNIPQEVVSAQRAVVERLLPEGWKFEQYFSKSYSHPAAMTICQAENTLPITIFLDIDCIPLTSHALDLIAIRAEVGMLVGAVQRANHIRNDCHLYVGPFCMAFDNRLYWEHGSPTFYETERGDVGEEVTYAWRGHNRSVYFLWPNKVEKPLWELVNGKMFGLGTTYENLFYHEFCARSQAGSFVKKCEEVLQALDKKVEEVVQ